MLRKFVLALPILLTLSLRLGRGDARPQTLLVDGFIVHVRKELLEKSLTATRAIVVEEDGLWKAKEEEKTGVRSDSLEREEAVTTTTTTKKVIEIVELD